MNLHAFKITGKIKLFCCLMFLSWYCPVYQLLTSGLSIHLFMFYKSRYLFQVNTRQCNEKYYEHRSRNYILWQMSERITTLKWKNKQLHWMHANLYFYAMYLSFYYENHGHDLEIDVCNGEEGPEWFSVWPGTVLPWVTWKDLYL